jgi:hypothetical protein
LKKLFSIALIALLLFNMMGYYGLFVGLQYKNDVSMAEKFDADTYEASQAVTLRIPLTVAYMPDERDFRRVDGTFEYRGEFYRLVKQKYAHDTLTVVCIKDNEHKRMHNALADYVKTFTDESSGQQNNGKVEISFIKDYIIQSFSMSTSTCGWEAEVIHNTRGNLLLSSFTPSVVHPPERA